MKIGKLQEKILRKAKVFLDTKKINKKDLSTIGVFYLCPFAATRGNAKLLSFYNKFASLKVYFYSTIKDLLNFVKFDGFATLDSSSSKNYKFVIVNWGTKKNFNYKGEYYDNHLNVSSSKCKNVLWYIIYLDKKLPKKTSKNVVLIYENKKLGFQHLKTIFKKFFFKMINLSFFSQKISHLSLLATYVYKDFDKYIHSAKKVLMPYEGQPFQNAIFQKISERNKKIVTIGFVHSFPAGLPSNFIKRSGHPKKLIINSNSLKYSFIKFLGWSSSDLLKLPSARFKKKSNNEMGNKVFLPYDFDKPKKIINSLNDLIDYKKLNFSNLEIRNHPSCSKSKKHLNLIKLINETIKNKTFKKKIRKNFSIFIGATGSIIEALERNLDVYHICENPVLESYSKKIWKHIDVKRLGQNLFNYKKVKNHKLIIFNNNEKIYKKYIY